MTYVETLKLVHMCHKMKKPSTEEAVLLDGVHSLNVNPQVEVVAAI